jgi:uncharacterized protein DUF3383
MSASLPISRLINISVSLTPAAAQSQNLSDLLILGSSDVIDVVERRRIYESITEVADDFGTTAPEYLSALLWFEQAPQPAEIQIGRWAQTATAARVTGSVLSATQQAIAQWNAVTTPAFFVVINGVPTDIAPASFATATNLNGIATLIQTALAAAVGGTTCIWDGNNDVFQIEDGVTGLSSTLSFLAPPTATGKITFAVNPVNNSTITLNGTVVTFVTVLTSGNQVLIGGTLAITLGNLLTFLNLNPNADVQIAKFTYLTNGTTILYTTAATAGAGGNALTIAASVATASGATLAGGSGTDISGLLAMNSTSSGAYVAQGIAAESALAAVELFDNMFGQQWYGVTVPQAVDSDHLVIAPFIEATNNKHVYGVSTQEAGVLSAVSTTDICYLLNAAGYQKTFMQYSSSNPYSVCSLLGRALTVNYSGNNTTITLMYKQEPGITPEALTETQITALEAKGCNVFVAYNNNTAIIEPGQAACGKNVFIDEITGIDWLAVTTMTAVYNTLYTSVTKVPQTDAGMHLLQTAMESVAIQGVNNGLLAPGTWNAGGFGTLNQGDLLAKGFYIYAPPVASQNQSDRAARKSVAFQGAYKLAGAVHTVSFNILVNP